MTSEASGMDTEKRFAVLIDADNISAKYIKVIMDEISNEGIATYKRIYGDWTKGALDSWKKVLLEYSVLPIQQYSYTVGKSSTDSALIIDAMDILYTGKVNGFCLISSDSDFTRLAARLRESGMMVIGMGEQKTPGPFIKACNQFKYLDKLFDNAQRNARDDDKNAVSKASEQPSDQDSDKSDESATDLRTVRKAIRYLVQENSDEEGWILCSTLGDLLLKRYPDFDVRNFGFSKMTSFLKSLDAYEMRYENKGLTKLVFIRIKPLAEPVIRQGAVRRPRTRRSDD
jgi:predicted nuclease of predicted toxin-antitoxin system